MKAEKLTLTVDVTGIGFGGVTIGKVCGGAPEKIGKKVLIHGAVPGEQVQVEVSDESASLIEGSVTEILVASPHRVKPPCPVFGTCGGCDFQQIEGKFQREQKRLMVENTLRFQGKLEPKNGVKLLGEDLPFYNYRRRIQLHVNDAGEIGFYRAGSGDIVDIDACLLADERLNEALKRIRVNTKYFCHLVDGATFELHGDSVFLNLHLKDSVRFGGDVLEALSSTLKAFPNVIISAKNSPVRAQLNFIVVSPKASGEAIGHFSQINDEGNKILISAVTSNIRSKTVTDLYAGSGNFSLPLARLGKSVCAVEIDEALVAKGDAQSELERLSVRFLNKSVENFMKTEEFSEAVVLDPPRAGAKQFAKEASTVNIGEIVYVSCNLPTLCRDLVTMVGNGFVLESVFVVDMFPQTHHVESVSVLRAA